MKKINQTGFSVVEALLILVIIAIIAFVGLYVVNAKQNTNNTLNTTSSTSAVAPVRQFKFKELGLEFNLPSALTKLSYGTTEAKTDTKTTTAVANTYYLYDTAIDNLGKQCQPNSKQAYATPSFAAIIKVNGTYTKPANAVTDGDSAFLKQFDGFYITYGVPNGTTCSTTDQALNNKFFAKMQQDQKAFATAFKATAAVVK